MASLTLPDGLIDPAVAPDSLTAQKFDTPGGNSVNSFILTPTPLQRTCSWRSTVDRSPRKTCAPASMPPQPHRPASDGLRPLS